MTGSSFQKNSFNYFTIFQNFLFQGFSLAIVGETSSLSTFASNRISDACPNYSKQFSKIFRDWPSVSGLNFGILGTAEVKVMLLKSSHFESKEINVL